MITKIIWSNIKRREDILSEIFAFQLKLVKFQKTLSPLFVGIISCFAVVILQKNTLGMY